MGSRFSELLFLDVPGTATEQIRTCGFRRKSSGLDKAPKIPDSVRLNSFEIFLVTLPSISSETWVMYYSATPWFSVFCDWLFLVFSVVSLKTVADFLLFLNVAITLTENLSVVKTELTFCFFRQYVVLLFYEGKGFNKRKQLTMENLITIPEGLYFI